MIAPVRRLGHYAYRVGGCLVLISVWVTVAAALGRASPCSIAVKPFGFQDPSSDSARADGRARGGDRRARAARRRAARRAAQATPWPRSATIAAARRAARGPGRDAGGHPGPGCRQLTSTNGTDVTGGRLLCTRAPTTSPTVGEPSRIASTTDPRSPPGGPAVTAHQLNQTTEDDLRRIEFFAAAAPPAALAARLPRPGRGLSSRWSSGASRSSHPAAPRPPDRGDARSTSSRSTSSPGSGSASRSITASSWSPASGRSSNNGQSTGEALVETMGSTGRMIVFSGLTVGVALASLAVFPQRFLYSIGVGGALVALSSAAGLPARPARPAGPARPPRERARAARLAGAIPSPAALARRSAGFVLRHPHRATLSGGGDDRSPASPS